MIPSDPESPPERRINWEEYSRLVKLLAQRVQERFQPETVVGIAHGGVIVGATIATILRRDFFPIKFSRRVNAQVVRKHSKLLVPPTAHLEGKRVLLVDDVSYSGETMRAALEAIHRHHPRETVTAVLVRSGAYEPDFMATYFPGKVIPPWQVRENGQQLPGAPERAPHRHPPEDEEEDE